MKIESRTCEICEKVIPKERLKYLPDTQKCVKCATENPDPPKYTADQICAETSEIEPDED